MDADLLGLTQYRRFALLWNLARYRANLEDLSCGSRLSGSSVLR